MFERRNNIEWLRLFFAFQVVLVHTYHHLEGESLGVLELMPGVPAFFFLSGFLIYSSYEYSKNIRAYFINRVLRLYPALIVVVLFSLLLVLFSQLAEGKGGDITLYFKWLFAQLSLGQAYNPSEFRGIGVGVMNGSLWTITVEILFYISVPILYRLDKVSPYSLPLFLIISAAIYVMGPILFSWELAAGKSVYDFLKLTPVVWGWMFLFGVLAFKYFETIKPFIKYFWVAFILMGLMTYLDLGGALFNSRGNQLGLVYFCCYVSLVLYLAFAIKYIPLNFDVSYGVYIWHMPIVNLLLVTGFVNVGLAIMLTLLLSMLSWFLIEKPALRLKKYSIRMGE